MRISRTADKEFIAFLMRNTFSNMIYEFDKYDN